MYPSTCFVVTLLITNHLASAVVPYPLSNVINNVAKRKEDQNQPGFAANLPTQNDGSGLPRGRPPTGPPKLSPPYPITPDADAGAGRGAAARPAPGASPGPPPGPPQGPPRFRIGQAVNTTSGIVQGHPAPGAFGVSEYLGIPYAKAATGDLRLAAPVAFTGSAKLPGNKFSADCPTIPPPSIGTPPGPPGGAPTGPLSPEAQSAMILGKLGSSLTVPGSDTSEDCLSINVWTKPQTGEKSKAVMMWIYGGGFQTGTSNAPAYGGAKIADQSDVVLVTFNYRTNFFGFGSPPNSTDYNFGFLDQRMATEWVRSNIEGFGGDPKRITLFGQSAGAASVDVYAYAWTEDPIVNAFIPESGATGVLVGGDPDAGKKWYNVTKALDCGGPEVAAAASLDCVRKKPLGAVINATAAVTTGFIPVVDNVTVFSDYAARGNAGKFIKRPVLVGNNDNEARVFAAGAALAGFPIPEAAQAGINADFTCPAGDAARYRSMNGVKAYRYLYMGDWPNLNISASTSGAFHSAEVPMIFGNAARIVGIPDNYTQTATATMMRSLWTTFAKDPDNAMEGFGLPVYDPKGNTLIQLGMNDEVLPVMTQSTMFDGPCNGTLSPFNPTLG